MRVLEPLSSALAIWAWTLGCAPYFWRRPQQLGGRQALAMCHFEVAVTLPEARFQVIDGG